MELTSWATTFSPNPDTTNTSNTTPGKSPYYPETIPHLTPQQPQQQQQQQLPSSNNSNNSNSMRFDQQPSNASTPQLPNTGNTPTAFTESDQMFLHQFDSNLYAQQHQHQHHQHQQEQQPYQSLEHQHHHSHTHHLPESAAGGPPLIPPPPQDYGFGLESINFIIPDDYNFDESTSSAFPPTQQHQETPSLLAVNKQQGQPGQQQQQQQQLPAKTTEQLHHSHSSQLFSPILPGQNDRSYNNQHYYHRQNTKIFTGSAAGSTIRPDVVFTPLASPTVTPLQKAAGSSASSSGGSNYQPPTQVAFEPLTSPALTAQQSSTTSSHDRRRSASSTFGPVPGDALGSSSGSSYKRRTPHGTPILAANNNSLSAVATAKYSPSIKPRMEKLPLSSYIEEAGARSKSTTPMLPPSGKPPVLNGSNTSAITSATTTAPNPSATPLMGFTMGRLAEQQEEEDDDDEDNQDAMSMSRSSTSNTSLNLSRKSSTSGIKKEKPATKKASHKLAEQGRRNRMNMAVHELGSLIPQKFHDEVAIPSKATTVELALKYIRALLNEMEGMKRELGR